MVLLLAVLAVIAWHLVPAAYAEDPASPTADEDAASTVLAFGYHAGDLKDGTWVGTFVEGVYFRKGEFSVESGSLVLWGNPESLRASGGKFSDLVPAQGGGTKTDGSASPRKKAADDAAPPSASASNTRDELQNFLGPVVYSLYAEGDVKFRFGNRTIRAETLFADFREKILVTGKVQITTTLALASRGRSLPLVVRAERLRQTAENAITLENATYTTCDFEVPHYQFKCTEFVLSEYDTYTSFTAWNNVIEYGPVPFFYIPVLGGRSDFSARPLRSVNLSRSSRFGMELELLWGDDIRLDSGDRWGEWRLHTDWRSRRGLGGGPELEYKQPGYEGEFRAYYQRDDADEDGFDDSPITRKDRGRVRWDHRQRLSEHWRVDLSLRDSSDRNFLPEYERKEALEERDPSTWVQLRYADRTDLFTVTARPRISDFRTETEALPELAVHRVAHPFPRGIVPSWLLDDVVWSGDAGAGVYERRFDEALGISSENMRREDIVGRVQGARALGPVRVQPFALAGATWESGGDFPGGEDSMRRGDMAAGVRATVEARREFHDVESDLLEVHGLRHLVSLDLLYYDRFAVSRPSSRYLPLDATETVDEMEAASVRLRQRLQTTRAGRRVDWIDFELRAYWLPDGPPPGRSPLGFREEGLLGPRFQDLHEEEKLRGRARRGPFGPYEADLRIQARDNLFLLGEAELEPYERRLTTAALGVRWFAAPHVSLYLGNRRIAHDSDIYTFRADWAVSDRWTIGVSQQADFREDKGLETSFRITRVLHDFVVEISMEDESTSDERTISLMVAPAALWVAPTSIERLGRLDYDAWRWYR
jgi:hypothetical protein